VIFIKTPQDLGEAIVIALNGTPQQVEEAISAIGTYKWYNYYCNIHIKKDSDADKENENIFDRLQKEFPEEHKLIEDRVNVYIERLAKDVDY